MVVFPAITIVALLLLLFLFSSKISDAIGNDGNGGDGSSSGGGEGTAANSFFDNYDDFVANLKLKDGGWDDNTTIAVLLP